MAKELGIVLTTGCLLSILSGAGLAVWIIGSFLLFAGGGG